jgi:undecaprenyl-diphosphatase
VHLLLNLDKILFYFANHSLVNTLFDYLIPFITDLNNWRIPIIIIWLILIFKGGKKGRVAAILLIFTITFCDQISASVLKPLVGRIRPCHSLNDVRLLVGCGGEYCFPSSHATNIAGFATIFSIFYRRQIILFWSIALITGFSRLYVGVHYPADVIYGFLLGSALAVMVFTLYFFFAQKFKIIHYLSYN